MTRRCCAPDLLSRSSGAHRCFDCLSAATPSEPSAAFLADPILQNKPLISRLRALFQERPIFSAELLLLSLSAGREPIPEGSPVPPEAHPPFSPALPVQRAELLHHLPAAAYRFSGGPWRN